MRSLLVLLLLAGPAWADQPRWAGIWAAEPDWCQWSHLIGSHNPAPIEITGTEFNGLENFCDIERSSPTMNNAEWLLILSCWSEGETYDEEVLVSLASDDQMALQYSPLSPPTMFSRCKE